MNNASHDHCLPPHSPSWFLQGSTPDNLTSDFVIRSLRRRLWKAFQEDNVETALRAYQATTQDLERWLEEEELERQSLPHHQNIAEKEKRSTGSSQDGKQKSLPQRPLTMTTSPPASILYEASFHQVQLQHLRGPVLQSQMNPSEPFIADDYLSPYDLESYEYPARKDLPNYDPLQLNIQPTNKERRPRLAWLQIFRKPGLTSSVVTWDEDVNRRLVVAHQNLQAAAATATAAGTTTTAVPLQTSSATTTTNTLASTQPVSTDTPQATTDGLTITTPLHEAARLGAGDFIRFLLAHGGDPNNKNGMGRSALHMASGGYTQEELHFLQHKKKTSKKKGKKKKVLPTPLGISAPVIPFEVFAVMKEQLKTTKKVKTNSAKKAAKAVGRFVKLALGSTKEKTILPAPSPPKRMKKTKLDSQKWKHLATERTDAVLAVLAWFHSETGDGPSINAVDSDGRTALHYAAELGRAEICMAILSNFGAMLTIIDDVGARTPCELAGENGHKELAARLEARALLYIDPYGVDDELMANMLQMEHNRSGSHDDERRCHLVTPYCWFETLLLDKVGGERLQRLEITKGKLLKVVQSRDVASSAMERLIESAADWGMDAPFIEKKGSSMDEKRYVSNNVDLSNQSTGTTGIGSSEEEDGKPFGKIKQEDLSNVDAKPSLQVTFSCLQEYHVERFLACHRWNVSEAIKVFKYDPLEAFSKAGIVLPSKAPTMSTIATNDRTCLICYDDPVGEEDWVPLSGCIHGFCTDCLKNYLKDCASTKMAFASISCPHHECDAVLSTLEIKQILEDEPDSAARIQEATNEQFVTSAHDFKFCIHPGCPGIVHRLSAPFLSKHGIDEGLVDFSGAVCTANHALCTASARKEDCPLTYEGVEDWVYQESWRTTQPRKAHRFCFACGEKPHWPISCTRLEEWKKKVQEEIGTVEAGDNANDFSELAQKLWIKTNTRPCPKCDVPIEKDDGCNHMTCTNPACRHEFCWICRKDWKLHGSATGGFFRCNIWQEDQDTTSGERPRAVAGDSDESALEQGYGTAIHSAREAFRVRQEMARFVHHYTRFEAHGESAALEQNMADTVCARLAPVVNAAAEFDGSPEFDFGGKRLSFVHAAFTELLECRSILKHSYAFSYFRYPSMYNFRRFAQLTGRRREKLTFERIQSELEMLTEQMSDIVARAHLRATQVQITFLTANAAEKREDFSNLIFSIFHEERKEAICEQKVFTPSTTLINRHSCLRGDDDYSSDDEVDRIRSSLNDILERTMPLDLEEAYAPPVARMWECSACTYMNSSGHHCAMCGSLR